MGDRHARGSSPSPCRTRARRSATGIEENDQVLAYIPDHEPALGVDLRTVSPDWVSGYSIAYGADYLLHDAQYSEEEYPEKVGWGHSSTDHVVSFASIAKVEHLVMFHHDPLHNDDHLEAMLARAGELWGEEGDAARARPRGHGDRPVLE